MKGQRTLTAILAAGVAALSVGVSTSHAQGAAGATAMLRDASGRPTGTALFTQVGGGVRITVQAQGLPPGPHGIHVHAVGQCDPPAFTSAGGHFNPTNRAHGLNNPQGAHAGDLPALMAAANGTASYAATNTMVTLTAGPNTLFDADGSALVIHAADDDQVTDPTGNSGDRIACGVIVRGAAALPATGAGTAPGFLGGLALTLTAGGAAALAALRRRSRR